jgi:hypothetical protein
MVNKIESKIVSCKVVDKNAPPLAPVVPKPLKRGFDLKGKTYKIKVPNDEHAVYLTINNIDVDGKLRPHECFAHSCNMASFQWTVALTRLASRAFRNGDSIGVVEEFKAVFDPRGGFYEKGRYYNSLVARMGYVIEEHLKAIGAIEPEGIPTHQQEIIESKKAEFAARNGSVEDKMKVCPSCQQQKAIVLDNCLTCVECGFSKCG